MRALVPYFALIAVMLATPQAARAGEAFPKVLVAVMPLKPYVDALMHGMGESQNLLRPGQDPHTFTLSPSQARALDEAEVLIIPDAGMSPLLMRQLGARKKIRVIELSTLQGADPLPYAEENPWLASVKKAGNDKDTEGKSSTKTPPKPDKFLLPTSPMAAHDPHFWLDPERMAALAEPLAESLAQSSPSNRVLLIINAKTIATHLRQEVLPAMKDMLQPKPLNKYGATMPEIPFITYHAAYQYFLARFGLTHTGEITARPEDYLGAKSLDKLLMTAKSVHIHCVIGEADNTLVHRIAAASGAKIVLLSPEQDVAEKDVPPLDWIRDGYDRLLYKTAKSFADCL